MMYTEYEEEYTQTRPQGRSRLSEAFARLIFTYLLFSYFGKKMYLFFFLLIYFVFIYFS